MENYKKCKVKNCNNNAHYTNYGVKGNCSKHRAQLKYYGKATKQIRDWIYPPDLPDNLSLSRKRYMDIPKPSSQGVPHANAG